jgi:hypothetical protein
LTVIDVVAALGPRRRREVADAGRVEPGAAGRDAARSLALERIHRTDRVEPVEILWMSRALPVEGLTN